MELKLELEIVTVNEPSVFQPLKIHYILFVMLKLTYKKQKTGKCFRRSFLWMWPGRVAQSVGHLTRKSEVLGSIPGLATYFRFSFR